MVALSLFNSTWRPLCPVFFGLLFELRLEFNLYFYTRLVNAGCICIELIYHAFSLRLETASYFPLQNYFIFEYRERFAGFSLLFPVNCQKKLVMPIPHPKRLIIEDCYPTQ